MHKRNNIQQLLIVTVAGLFLMGNNIQAQTGKFRKIFDGKTLDGWAADSSFWRVENGCLVGEVREGQPIKTNSFLIWKKGAPADFEFKAEYRISKEGNSGVNYRSVEVPGISYALKGYQADIDGENRYTGQNYEERGRGFLAMRGQQARLTSAAKPLITGSLGDSDTLKAKIKTGEWNSIHIIARGNHLLHYINGVLMSEVWEENLAEGKIAGLIGLQVHVMPFMKVEYREVYLKEGGRFYFLLFTFDFLFTFPTHLPDPFHPIPCTGY